MARWDGAFGSASQAPRAAMLALHMASLDARLEDAATAAGWTQVVHRCAWCGGVADAYGEYSATRSVSPSAVVTDGMCPPCGTRALAHLTARRLRRAA